jgi:hypothetical protein
MTLLSEAPQSVFGVVCPSFIVGRTCAVGIASAKRLIGCWRMCGVSGAACWSILLLAAIAYLLLQRAILRQAGPDSTLAPGGRA